MFGKKDETQFKYPGVRMAMDGNSAVILCEREGGRESTASALTFPIGVRSTSLLAHIVHQPMHPAC
jgi:hypothetical protein